GQPAATLPAGFGGDGLPLSVQLVGRTGGRGRAVLAGWSDRVGRAVGRSPTTAGDLNETAGELNETVAELNQTAGELNETPAHSLFGRTAVKGERGVLPHRAKLSR